MFCTFIISYYVALFALLTNDKKGIFAKLPRCRGNKKHCENTVCCICYLMSWEKNVTMKMNSPYVVDPGAKGNAPYL